MFTPRLSKILLICLENDAYTSIDDLSSQLQISKRTVFREVQSIDGMLKSYGVTLKNKPKCGLFVEGSLESKFKLKKELEQQVIEYRPIVKRQEMLIFELLRSEGVCKMQYYAHILQVSEATISSDLIKIEPWFDDVNLKLIKTPGVGVELVGHEKDYRQALTNILSKVMSHSHVLAMEHIDDVMSQFLNKNESIMKLLNQDVLLQVLHVLQDHRDDLNFCQYTQSSYIGLVMHITIAIDRILKKEEMEHNAYAIEWMREKESYNQAKHLVAYLEDVFDILIPEVEVAFIAMHINGAKLIYNLDSDGLDSNKQDQDSVLLGLIKEMIESLDTPYCYYFLEDEELWNGLMVHLKPTLIRLEHKLPIHNPLLAQIQELYPCIYEQAKRASKVIEEYSGQPIREDEIGFLAMHFGAALERLELETTRELHVGIVCASGIGVSSLLLARIRKVVDENVKLETLSIYDLTQKQDQYDLLVSTFPMEEQGREKIIFVHPLISTQDIQSILKEVKQIRSMQSENHNYQSTWIDLGEQDRNLKELLETISITQYEPNITKMQLIEHIANQVSSTFIQKNHLMNEMLKREANNSVVFSEAGFALFHLKDESIQRVEFHVLRPTSKVFQDVSLTNIKFAISMFMPFEHTASQKYIMGELSKQLIDNEVYANNLIKGSMEELKFTIQDIFNQNQEKANASGGRHNEN